MVIRRHDLHPKVMRNARCFLTCAGLTCYGSDRNRVLTHERAPRRNCLPKRVSCCDSKAGGCGEDGDHVSSHGRTAYLR